MQDKVAAIETGAEIGEHSELFGVMAIQGKVVTVVRKLLAFRDIHGNVCSLQENRRIVAVLRA